MKRNFSLVIFALACVMISACAATPTSLSTSTSPSRTATAPVIATGSGYPAPGATGSAQGYPGAATSNSPGAATPGSPTPTSDPKLGNAAGVIRLHGQPVSNVLIYLGQLLKDNSGQESVIALDPKVSPWAPTEADGHFRIVNVTPGRYGLVLVTVTASYHLLYPNKHESVIVTIEAGKDSDVGVLDYVTLPIPSP